MVPLMIDFEEFIQLLVTPLQFHLVFSELWKLEKFENILAITHVDGDIDLAPPIFHPTNMFNESRFRGI